MMNAAAGMFASMVALGLQQAADLPQRVDYCDLVKSPEQFASRTVIVEARLTRLTRGEWGLDSHCFQPTLLVFPDDVLPKPDFQLQKSEGVRLMLQSRQERRVLFRGDFVGRFDLAQTNGSGATFGKSRVRMRFVLRDIQDPERIVILGK
jgi:hypothetical protein